MIYYAAASLRFALRCCLLTSLPLTLPLFLLLLLFPSQAAPPVPAAPIRPPLPPPAFPTPYSTPGGGIGRDAPPPSSSSGPVGSSVYTGGPDPESGDGMDLVSSSSALDLPSMAVSNKAPELRFKIALSLYKVQQNIYLLDFQRIEGDILGFMKLCTLVISELKNLSAAQRQAQLAQQAAGVPPQGR